MRLFIAINLSDDVKRALAGCADLARRSCNRSDWQFHQASWVRRENLHLTLKFLGEVPDSQVAALCDRLRGVAVEGPIALRTDGPLFFPKRGRIHVAGARVVEDSDARLERLHRGIEAACEDAGFAREQRAFQPHITLLRSRAGLPDEARGWGRHDFPGLDVPVVRIDATELVLVESRLSPSVAQYVVAGRFGLQRAG